MSKIVQLSEAASIGLHAMVLIAQSDKLVKVTEIARITGASKNHLSKVMQRFVKDGLIKSTRGPSGGFLLNKNADEITLLDIYQSVEGEISNISCPLNNQVCHTNNQSTLDNNQVCPFNQCIMGGVVEKMTEEFVEYFKNQTLKNLVCRDNEMKVGASKSSVTQNGKKGK